MTTPAEYHLLVIRGDKHTLSAQYTDETEEPIDISDYTVTWTFTFNDEDLVLTDGDGLTVTPLTGTVALLLTSEQTTDFSSSRGTHRLRLIDGDDEPMTLLWGSVTVKARP